MQAAQSVMVVRADDEEGGKGGCPDDRRLRGSRSLKNLLRAPPGRKRNRDNSRTRTNL